MDFQELYLSASGRISRKGWWLGIVLMIVAAAVLGFVLSIVGLGRWASLIGLLIFAYPSWCLGIKRRQDRDNNGLDYKVMFGLSTLLTLLQVFGIGMAPTDLGNGMVIMQPTGVMMIVQLIIGVFGIYMLIQLGFLRGTPGPNSYGPDPLGYAATA